ncbi:MAG: sulfite exporter TauE/SafE family protein [Bacteroidetes bacterium]|nr:MAG: sulfite exporter TauE/SafE family protein [Bacteroidota bacterium]
MDIVQFIILGFLVGVLSGMIGVGGAVFIVPALVYLFGWQQHMAQGTTLAMLVPPIGILAAWKYYQAGNVNLKVAGLLCAGFFVGSLLGGIFANQLPGDTLRRVFGAALLIVSIKMVLGK